MPLKDRFEIHTALLCFTGANQSQLDWQRGRRVSSILVVPISRGEDGWKTGVRAEDA